jgi:transposase
MPSPLSVDLRERVVASVVAGASCHRAAARFGVSVSSASRWSERFRHEGQLASKRWAVITPRSASRRMPGRS